MFAKDVVGCFCHGCVKAVHQRVYFAFLIFKSEEWSKLSSYRCLKHFCDVGVLEFLQTKNDPFGALLFHPLEAELEGHHYKFMVTSNIGYWKAPGTLVHASKEKERKLDHRPKRKEAVATESNKTHL